MAEVKPHLFYGPCDDLGPNGECSQCVWEGWDKDDEAGYLEWFFRGEKRAE